MQSDFRRLSLPYGSIIVGMLYVNSVELSFGLGDRVWATEFRVCVKAYLLVSLPSPRSVIGRCYKTLGLTSCSSLVAEDGHRSSQRAPHKGNCDIMPDASEESIDVPFPAGMPKPIEFESCQGIPSGLAPLAAPGHRAVL